MTYRAPVADIAFTLKHGAGLRAGAGRGPLRRSQRGRGRRGAGGGRPVRHRRASRRSTRSATAYGTPFKDGAVTTPPGWKEAYRAWAQAGWNGLAAPAQWGGQALPHALNAACIEMWNSAVHGVRHRPGADHGRRSTRSPRTAATSSSAPICRKLVSGEWMGTMQLTEPQAGSDVGALRTKRRARRRRQLSHHRAEDLHHLRRARSHRQHHPFRAGAAARRAAGHARHLAVPGAEIPAQRRRLARRAQRRARAFDRAQARHPRLADLHHGLRRPRRRHRLPRRRGEPRHGLHVHHDEPRAARGRPAGRRHRRARDPAGARLCARAQAGPRRRRASDGIERRSSSIPTSSACC